MSDYFEKGGFNHSAAWHKMGRVADTPMTDMREFLVFSEMDHQITKEPAIDTVSVSEAGEVEIKTLESQFHLRRSSDRKIVSKSTVGKVYRPFQPSQMIEVLQPYIDEGFATPDAAFSLYDGSMDVVTLRLDFSFEDPSSEWLSYLTIKNTHGGGALAGVVSTVRAVCANTVTASFCKGSDFSIRHSAAIQSNYDNAITQMESLKEYLRVVGEKVGALSIMPVDVESTVEGILGIDEKSSKRQRIQAAEIVYNSRYSPGVKGDTALDVLNGFTYYTTHDKGGKGGKNYQDRLESLMGGSRKKMQEKALSSLLELV